MVGACQAVIVARSAPRLPAWGLTGAVAPTLRGLMMKPNAQTSLLPDAAEPAPPSPDRATVFDALAFAQAPVTANQLLELIAHAGVRASRGGALRASDVRSALGELAEQGL